MTRPSSRPKAPPKRLVICLDGTWNHPAKEKDRDDGDRVYKPTNVLKTCRAILPLDEFNTLILDGLPSDGEWVSLAGRTYTFRAALTGADDEVKIASDSKKTIANLIAAINGRSGRGSKYSRATAPHTCLKAKPAWGSVMVVRHRPGGPPCDLFNTDDALADGGWVDSRAIASVQRQRGVDSRQGIEQVSYYDIGVGGLRKTVGSWNRVHSLVDNALGGARGAGLEGNVEDAYRFLVHNYREGDEIFIFGFSRGAAAARSLANFMQWMGGLLRKTDAYWIPRFFDSYWQRHQKPELNTAEKIRQAIYKHLEGLLPLKPKHANKGPEEIAELARKQLQPAQGVRIRFLGVWDTVLALDKKRNRMHLDKQSPNIDRSPDYPPENVANARQALAIDEKRFDFQPWIWSERPSETPQQSLQQRWFAGVHSNVGGGYIDDGLANVALHWMLREAQRFGLGLDWRFLGHYKPYLQDQLYNSSKTHWKIMETVRLRRGKGHRDLRREGSSEQLALHHTVLQRLAADPWERETDGRLAHPNLALYRPRNLLDYLASLADLDALDSFAALDRDEKDLIRCLVEITRTPRKARPTKKKATSSPPLRSTLPAPVHLAPGDARFTTAPIVATARYGRTGLEVMEKERYRIRVEILEPLYDHHIRVCDTSGFPTESLKGPTRWLLKAAESRRRAPEESWFRLIGAIGESEEHLFPIGAGREIEIPASGELFVFLNDHPKHLDNNQGSYRLKVRRLQAGD